jgi:hypothetical protein
MVAKLLALIERLARALTSNLPAPQPSATPL